MRTPLPIAPPKPSHHIKYKFGVKPHYPTWRFERLKVTKMKKLYLTNHALKCLKCMVSKIWPSRITLNTLVFANALVTYTVAAYLPVLASSSGRCSFLLRRIYVKDILVGREHSLPPISHLFTMTKQYPDTAFRFYADPEPTFEFDPDPRHWLRIRFWWIRNYWHPGSRFVILIADPKRFHKYFSVASILFR
jgi:hypothetical protein